MHSVIKTFLSLLMIMHGTFDLINKLFYYAREMLGVGVDRRLSGQQQVNRK